MDNFKAIYTILTALERDMDKKHADISKFNHEVLCISEERWMKYMEMMFDVGYIKGIRIIEADDGWKRCDCQRIEITLKGLEYLQENGIMRKIYNAAKGIKEIVPGI